MIPTDKKPEVATILAHSALLGTAAIYDDRRLDNLPTAIRDGLIVRAALAYLIEHDVITTTPVYDEPAWMPLSLPDWFERVIAEQVALRTQAVSS